MALDIFEKELKPEAEILITGAWGGRFDHLFSIIFTAASRRRRPFCIADEREGLVFIRNGFCEFSFDKPPRAVSLLPLSEVCRGVSVSNVRWPLENAELRRSLPYAVSNGLSGGLSTRVACEDGTLGFYWLWDETGFEK